MTVGSTLLRGRLLHCFSPRVLCVASNLLYKHNQYINNGYNQYRQHHAFSHSLNTGGSALSNANMPSGHFDHMQGLLQMPRQSIKNLTAIRSYGRQRFTPELALTLSESEIINGVQTGRFAMDYVLLTFARKQIYKDREFNEDFKMVIGHVFVENYSSMEFFHPKAKWLMNSLINLNYCLNPSFIDLPVRLIQNGCKDENLRNELLQLAGFLPLLDWASPPPQDKLMSICQLVMSMISTVEDRYLTYLLHTWCKDNQWKQIAKEHLITEKYLKECQRRVPNIDVTHLVQLLEAVCDSLPLHVQLPSGWLEDVRNRLLEQKPSAREAATFLDAFHQIQLNCCPTQQHLTVPVAKRMFRLSFDPKEQNIDQHGALLTCLVLRALGELGIDPGDLDKRFWPWFWKNSESSLKEWSDDQRVMVLDALCKLRIPASPRKWLQQIINTIKADNPMHSASLLYSLFRIKQIVPDIEITDTILRSLTKSYYCAVPKLSGKHLVVGAWSLAQHEFNPRKVHAGTWREFYKQSMKHMNAFSSHQQSMLLTVLWKFRLEPPIEWMKAFLAAIDKTPPENAEDAAHMLWYFMLLHKHFPHPESNTELLVLLAQKDMILKFYNHWVNGLDSLERGELLFALKAMNYFGLDPVVCHPEIFEKWCMCMKKYIGKMPIEGKDKVLLLEVVAAYQDQLPSWFVELVKQNSNL